MSFFLIITNLNLMPFLIEKTPADDFTIYVNITSKDVPTDSPNGSENWFVMINTPADHGQNWEKIVNELRKKTIIKLNRILKVDLESND